MLVGWLVDLFLVMATTPAFVVCLLIDDFLDFPLAPTAASPSVSLLANSLHGCCAAINGILNLLSGDPHAMANFFGHVFKNYLLLLFYLF